MPTGKHKIKRWKMIETIILLVIVFQCILDSKEGYKYIHFFKLTHKMNVRCLGKCSHVLGDDKTKP